MTLTAKKLEIDLSEAVARACTVWAGQEVAYRLARLRPPRKPDHWIWGEPRNAEPDPGLLDRELEHWNKSMDEFYKRNPFMLDIRTNKPGSSR